MTRRAIAVVLVLCLTGCAGSAVTPTSAPPQAPSLPGDAAPVPQEAPVSVAMPVPAEPPPPPPKPPLTVIAVGDMMIGTDFPEDRLPPDDGAGSFSQVAPILRDADVTFGNLEGVLLDGGEPFKVCKNPALCYLFRTPSRYGAYYAEAGFDVMSLANNHARDFGEEGRTATMQTLDQLGIVHSGRLGDIASWKHNDYALAMIAFAPNPDSHDLNDIPLAVALVADLARTHDIVMVSFHGGAEGLDALHVSFGNEVYYGEQRGNVVDFAHQVIDAGADLVIGHGPHVPRGLEIYAQRLIAYSLGNFNTYQGISIQGIKGLAPILKVRLNENGEFLDGRIISTRQARPGGPQPDDSHEAARLMQELSTADFGARAPLIDKDGFLRRSEP